MTFTTSSSKPSVSGETFSNVGATNATVSAQVETGGLETPLRCNGITSAYGSETAGVTVPVGATTASTELTGLASDTEYHFRVLVANTDGSEMGAVDTVFDTLPAGTYGLPDNRVYEMVSPVEDGNSDAEAPNSGAITYARDQGVFTRDPFQVSPDGAKVTYSVLAINGANGGEIGDQYLAVRSPTGGWSQAPLQPNARSLTSNIKGFPVIFRWASFSLVLPAKNRKTLPPLTADAPGEGYQILYERETGESGYRALITNAVKG